MCVKETRFLFPVIFMVWGFSEVRGRERKINDVEMPYSALLALQLLLLWASERQQP